MFVILDDNGFEMRRVEALPKLEYDLSELNEPYDNRVAYPTVTATDPWGHVVSVTTNRAGEGEFKRVETPLGVEYRQTRGTLQLQLSHLDQGVKKTLNNRWKAKHVRDADDWDAERQVLRELEEQDEEDLRRL
ncbi:hypothetical protein [Bifidobacterium eulemuris]|uniref:Uncharacterized protein n=2 Tax=Bifidobacterium eulemuris TaxID=1765219 RepID=A0A261GA06_9BIFI|nr:hypothetical protein [Bifidobacterium eulemuris]OZG68250.1 hypothetical protein BEUL_1263 [Bifidobacterium eulemuris]QOL31694.1 hypothetical protein BE0216_03875 [Bifidobacterium eulemuris]